MSGRHTGGVRGTVLLRGDCLVCGRTVAGGNSEHGDARNSKIMLRQHNNPATRQRCTGSRDRVPTNWDATQAWAQGKREAFRTHLDALTVRPHEDPPGCPICGSDDYDTELGEDSQPDYEHGLKTCQECGEQWL